MKEVRQASAPAKFRLLMWKNFLQQWRHRAQTLTEVLLPVGTMALVLILRSQIEPVNRETFLYPPLPAHTQNFSLLILGGMDLMNMSLAYSPTSPVLEDVLTTAMATLFGLNLMDLIAYITSNYPEYVDLIPPDLINGTDPAIIDQILRSIIRIDGYDNSIDLKTLYVHENDTRRVIAAVQFDDSLYDATELPYDVSYSLRFPERPRLHSFASQGSRSWRTDSVFPLFPVPGPRFPNNPEGGRDPGYVIEMFVALQQVISTELISRLTNQNIRNFKVHIQRYPHPSYYEDLAIEVLQFIFSMFIMLSFSYTAVSIVKAVTIEKELQLKESMKIMGLSTWLHWTAWFFKQFIFLLAIAMFVVILLKVNWFTTAEGFSDYSVFTNTPWTVLFFFLTLYLAATIFFCFMISGIFSKANTAALFAGVVWFLTYVPAFLLAMDISMSTAVQAITCLSINSAMAYGFQLLLAREATGGMQWGEFFSSPTPDTSRFLFGHVVVMMSVNCVVYMLIALYLEQVRPGSFGVPQPWYFPLLPSFWCPSTRRQFDKSVAPSDDDHEIIMETEPTDHTVGVKISELTKIFARTTAVNRLSLNIYDDQITVLLGHNGAGKSTTISMLTGNLQPTSGSVLVAGYDIGRQTSLARAHIGLCPQHNVLFNELTVREHLEFFARLKGFKGKELYEDIDSIIHKLELADKRDYQAAGLSGGQKRRLSVGVALCGSSRVILLDEPTSGMDPSSRRALWDLLQKEKKGRSMILTTHFMDEADILGDRVAIMASGRLQCVGSPYFLKQHYGVGYTLVVVKDEHFNEAACTKVIAKYIPDITVKEDRGTEVAYALSNDHSHVFENILIDLEKSFSIIHYKNYGLDATTMEDVFMSVGSDVVTPLDSEDGAASDVTSNDFLRSELDSSLEELVTKESSVTGPGLWVQHTLSMWFKLWLVWSRSYGLVILQLSVPILQISATLLILRYVMSFVEDIRSRELSLTDGFARTETWLQFNGTNLTSLGALASEEYERAFNFSDPALMALRVTEQPLDELYLEEGMDPATMAVMRTRMLIGATFDDHGATAWFSNFGFHDVATSLATVHSAILRANIPEATIKVFNYPLQATYSDQTDMQLMVTMLSIQLAAGIGNSLGIVSAVFIMFYIKERASRAKLLQKASGVEPVLMWTSAAIFDWLWFLIICLPILVVCVSFQVIGLSTGPELGRLYVSFMVYGAAMLPLNYLLSNVFSKPSTGFVLNFFINVLLGMMGAQIVEALLTPGLHTEQAGIILDYILQFFPLYSLVTSVRKLNMIGLTVWSCLQMCDQLLAVPGINVCTLENACNITNTCCIRDNPYFEWEDPGIARYLTSMVGTCLILWGILMLVEYRIVQRIFHRRVSPPPVDEALMDADVVAESAHVAHVAHVAGSTLGNQNLLAVSLTKYYGRHLAVNQVSFSVGESECFGLLGVNGAGKTSTFKMLMGDESVSSGNAYVKGHSVKSNLRKVHENIGYCPQFDALFPELSGRETLRLFASLRGLRSHTTDALTAHLAASLGFTKHLDKRVKQYSGGNKRKLSTAVAMMGHSRLVFLDEPTTGVDPAAKRQVWRAIRRATHSGRGVVLTSHSMEECEALCSRLTIMVNGQFQCLGTPQHLKNRFSQGFTLTIKMKVDSDACDDEIAIQQLDVIKLYIDTNFCEPKLMEEYKGLLTYYLQHGNMPWSQMFGIMERAKRDLHVEDYTIAQTTLEQIFLQFTKYQQQSLEQATHSPR